MLLTAFLIALVIFVAGLYAGFILDSYRAGDAGGFVSTIELDTESFVVENEFFDAFGPSDCGALNGRMDVLGGKLLELGNTLARYDAKKIFKGSEYEQLRRRYFLLEIRAYTMRKQMEENCSGETSNVLLFFYNTKNNQESLNQGYALDYIAERYSDVVILSFDKDFDDPALRSLMKFYGINSAPTIVLNFKTKIEGYIPQHELREYMR